MTPGAWMEVVHLVPAVQASSGGLVRRESTLGGGGHGSVHA